MNGLKFDGQGLLPTVVQDIHTGKVLMLAYMNEESLQKTIESGETWFYSCSRAALWHKGETSGHVQKVWRIDYDCDGDALLVLVEQQGAACHTGAASCFYRTLCGGGEPAFGNFLAELELLISTRKVQKPVGSYVASLLASEESGRRGGRPAVPPAGAACAKRGGSFRGTWELAARHGQRRREEKK